MKNITFLILFFLNPSFVIAQDWQILDAIDNINNELGSNRVLSIDTTGHLSILDLDINHTYTFPLKEVDEIYQEIQLSTLVIVFACTNKETCFVIQQTGNIEHNAFYFYISDIPPNADVPFIVKELQFIKKRL